MRPAGPEPLLAAAARALGRSIADATAVGGGDINDAWLLDFEDGSRAFLKSRPDAPQDEFGAEAAGLRWLADAGGLRVPDVLAVLADEDVRGLVLEWVEPGSLSTDGAEELGRGLAAIHGAGAPAFDTLPPGSPRKELRFGGGEVESFGGERWSDVYEARLGRLADLARSRGRVTERCAETVARVRERLDELAGPPEPPARVHGDLWSGNVLVGADGSPRLVDPKAHGAHREMDLAMLELFGTVAPRTLAAYEEVHPLGDGWEDRIGLWQLQPLLVHAILFGGSYGAAVERTAARYS